MFEEWSCCGVTGNGAGNDVDTGKAKDETE
jgi:hypothetical protein